MGSATTVVSYIKSEASKHNLSTQLQSNKFVILLVILFYQTSKWKIMPFCGLTVNMHSELYKAGDVLLICRLHTQDPTTSKPGLVAHLMETTTAPFFMAFSLDAL